MEKNKKAILFAVFSLVLIYFIIVLISAIPKSKSYKKTIFVGDSTKINVDGSSIKVYSDNSEISNQEAKYYFKNQIVDGYITSKKTGINNGINEYYIYTKEGKVLLFDSVPIGFTKDLTVNFINFESKLSTNFDEASRVIKLSGIEIPDNSKLSFFNISTFDVDNDDFFENVYSIGINEGEGEFESFAILEKNDKYYLIARESSTIRGVRYTSFKFTSILDVNNDGRYEYIINRSLGEYGPNDFELYSFDGSSFTKIGGE